MKNLILILTFFFAIFATSFAQSLPNTPVTVVPSKTSLLNSDASVATAPNVKPYYKTFVFTITVTQNTGTLAGTVTFQGSLDGTKFFPITTTTLTAGVNDLSYRENGTAYNQYRISVATTGTSTSTVSNTKFLYKQGK